jgi:hypothetical protein
VTHKPLVVPLSIRIPKSLELKLRSLLVENNGIGYQANTDLTKALESALGCSIKNFNFFLPECEATDVKPDKLPVISSVTGPDPKKLPETLNGISRCRCRHKTSSVCDTPGK